MARPKPMMRSCLNITVSGLCFEGKFSSLQRTVNVYSMILHKVYKRDEKRDQIDGQVHDYTIMDKKTSLFYAKRNTVQIDQNE